MNLSLGYHLRVRSMVYVAAEPVPFFWPMRTFIHHNPLYGLERLRFQDAVEQAADLFGGRGFLCRSKYQRYLNQGKVDKESLRVAVETFVREKTEIDFLDLRTWLMALMTQMPEPVFHELTLAQVHDVHAVLGGRPLSKDIPMASPLDGFLSQDHVVSRPIYETVDLLYGTEIAGELDELVIKSCLDFFDEGQSVWNMPCREEGFFAAWRQIARRNVRLFLRGRKLHEILSSCDTPEDAIIRVMNLHGVPEEKWIGYFQRELARLHGWTGFIRWRSGARHYYWSQRYPADLVDFLAVRLTLGYALLQERTRHGVSTTTDELKAYLQEHPEEAYLRCELHSRHILSGYAQRVEETILQGRRDDIKKLYFEYVERKRHYEARIQADLLRKLALHVGDASILERLSVSEMEHLVETLRNFEKIEGMIWLCAMEAYAIDHLVSNMDADELESRANKKRPYVQALFCIDVRSERYRRALESVGDYQTFGIAGFFGVPLSFMELGKGSEIHLCPVLLTPKNLIMEVAAEGTQEATLGALEKALHELKESVFAPYFTVEAIGLLFGIDMIGKTVAPRQYNRWRGRLHPPKQTTRLLLDKLTRVQADSIVRAVQRAVIGRALQYDLEMSPEQVKDDLVRTLREEALEHSSNAVAALQEFDIDSERAKWFIERLRTVYRINRADARMQMERLGRIGFTLEEQVGFVGQALRSIGLTDNFSRFILVVGHGSQSENNPYESALDCGACGGNHGLINARAFAQMANKPEVRERLRENGLVIPHDTWFVPALHNTTTDEVSLFDLELLPSSHLVYLDRLRSGLFAATRLCVTERIPELEYRAGNLTPTRARRMAQRNASDWSQVRPEWGLARNAYFVIGRRWLTKDLMLEGRAFLHSYDYRVDHKRRLLENILTGPLVVGQWINMEHYFSAVDNEHYGSGSKAYHNVAGRFGVMTGNLSDLRTGLPSQTVLADGFPYHEPIRLVTVIEAPLKHALAAIENVAAARRLFKNDWIRLVVVDPESSLVQVHEDGHWKTIKTLTANQRQVREEVIVT